MHDVQFLKRLKEKDEMRAKEMGSEREERKGRIQRIQRIEERMQHMKKVFKQLGKVLCYVALFLGLQVIVLLGCQLGWGFFEGSKLVEQLGPGANEELVKWVLDVRYNQFLAKYTSLILIVTDSLVLLFLWVFFAIRKKKLAAEAGMRKFSVGFVPWIILAGAALAVFISFAMSFLPKAWLMEYAAASNSVAGKVTILSLAATVVAAPVVEEILFRGIILSRLGKAMPAAPAVLLSALVFGLMHGQVLWIAYAAFLGIVLALVAVKTKSILATMLMHVTFNLAGMLIPHFAPQASGAVYLAITAVSGVLAVLGMVMILRRKGKNVQDTDHRG